MAGLKVQYAVVEFEKKECGVVPLMWLRENNTQCYWPKNRSPAAVRSLVKNANPPAVTWPLFAVAKLYSVHDSIESAEETLNAIIEQSSHSESSHASECLRHIIIKEIQSDENDTDGSTSSETDIRDKIKKRKYNKNATFAAKKKKKYLKKNVYSNENKKSSSDMSDSTMPDDTNQKNLQKSVHTKTKEADNGSKSDSSDDSVTLKNISHLSSFQNRLCINPQIISPVYYDKYQQYYIGRPLSQSKPGKKKEKNLVNKVKRIQCKQLSKITKQLSKIQKPIAPIIYRNTNSPPVNISQDCVLPSRSDTPQNYSTPSSSTSFNPSTASSFRAGNFPPQQKKSSFEETVIKKLETIIATQDQNTVRIAEINRLLMTDKNKNYATRPDDFPIFPIDHKDKFKEVERQLRETVKYDYLKNRLAAIGGSSVRLATNNMLKYTFTNRIARKFNWAGHNEKKSFKKTKIWEIIREAIHLHFAEFKPSDLNDMVIVKAVQDWLRLANQRYENEIRRQRNE